MVKLLVSNRVCCDTCGMTERPRLTLIQGGDAPHQVDLTGLLENMDAREAIPQLRALARRRKPAANSALAVVGAVTPAATAPDHLDSDNLG